MLNATQIKYVRQAIESRVQFMTQYEVPRVLSEMPRPAEVIEAEKIEKEAESQISKVRSTLRRWNDYEYKVGRELKRQIEYKASELETNLVLGGDSKALSDIMDQLANWTPELPPPPDFE